MTTVKKGLHMNSGDSKTSYANNSVVQKFGISKTWSVLDETLKDMFNTHENGFPKCLKMADLGCSSGSNTLSVISHVMDTIQELCTNNNVNDLPQLEVFLNDLPDNDFNNLFKLLSSFSPKLECFIYGVPGSFYGRLFPANTLHFAYSSFSTVSWLSQIPEGLGKNNKENIYMSMTSPRQVFDAYANQFQRDFSKFLSFRHQEMIAGGRMVLAFIGRRSVDPYSADAMPPFTMLAETLSDMVAEGLIKKDDLYSFNIPYYTPSVQEVEAIISSEGSFNLDKAEVVFMPWDANNDYDNMVFDKYESGKLVANCLQATLEPLLVCHFGSSIDIDAVFHRYTSKIAECWPIEESSYFTQVISLTRK